MRPANKPFTSRGCPKGRISAGYALLEVMIAVAMVSIALPALVLTVNQVMSQTADVKIDSMAEWVALNQMELVKLTVRINADKQQQQQTVFPFEKWEMAGLEWQGNVLVEPSPMPGIQRVTVNVGLKEDETRASVVGFVYVPDNNRPKRRRNVGGSNNGGNNTGGNNPGGTDTGGSDTGGLDAGGNDLGGSDTGGSDLGGSDTGDGNP